MLSYKLCKKLKKAGFPQLQSFIDNKEKYKQHFKDCYGDDGCSYTREPILSELIEACGDQFNELINLGDKFISYGGGFLENCQEIGHAKNHWVAFGEGKTPEEAVANLYLALKK